MVDPDPQFAQLRTYDGGLSYYPTLVEALKAAEQNKEVFKLSFNAATGERVRLIRSDNGDWHFDPIVVDGNYII